MKLISVNAGLPREIFWKNRVITTGIFKEPVAGRVAVRKHNLDGDRQADLKVHGGPEKAAYAYPSEHYDFWRGELPGVDLPWGMFGENFTTEGLIESEVNIGDRFLIGSNVLMVTQPQELKTATGWRARHDIRLCPKAGANISRNRSKSSVL